MEERLFNPSFLNLGESEIIPRRDGNLFLKRRASRFLIDISLCLRRLAHKNSITMNQRLTWQKWMLRTRILDDHLKDLYTNGIHLPDGGKFTGKGFRSTWQEGIVACASALRNNYDDNSENIDFPDANVAIVEAILNTL